MLTLSMMLTLDMIKTNFRQTALSVSQSGHLSLQNVLSLMLLCYVTYEGRHFVAKLPGF